MPFAELAGSAAERVRTAGNNHAADDINGLLTDAGRLVGLADFRPTYGRFRVTRYELLTD